MDAKGYGRHWARHAEQHCAQHRGWPGSDWPVGDWSGRPGGSSRPGPPPWLAGLFGLAQGEQQRGPRVRRGDVRAAILDVLATEPMNGYQVIQQIAERSQGAWRPSPGSVYPTIQQLEDEGLITADEPAGRRTLRLTAEGEDYVAGHPEELAAVWERFQRPSDPFDIVSEFAAMRPELGQLMAAVWQIITSGTDQQRRDAVAILSDTRRRLYGLLAEQDADQ